ncbi:MAG: NADH-quinone oxidoreductase subunit M [Gordonia sp. (in: high G+C Gram-positive bacteria)]|uniref:NADH-quinone oxidoreductase subunit M n=1 Tax=Gordonia sp. (in: high G+C Gram-positive bacteria) TaxID=84139 RepID=UPI0039E4420D
MTILWLIPAVASAVVVVLPPRAAELAKRLGLGAAAATAVWAVIVAVRFSPGGAGGQRFQLVEDVSWIPALGARYTLALDGIGLALVLLTALLTPLLLLAAWRDVDGDGHGHDDDGSAPRRVHAYFALFLAIEAMVLISFVAIDVLLFYLVFEAMLIPMYFLIGGYGVSTPLDRRKDTDRRRNGDQRGDGDRRRDGDQREDDDRRGDAGRRGSSQAAVRFLLYNLLGGLVMLAAVIGLYTVSARTGSGTFSLTALSTMAERGESAASSTTLHLLFLGFLFAFAVKAPLWPLHGWLPDAAVAATPASAVLMMAVMDKVGTFAMLRFCLGLFPESAAVFAPIVSGLAVVSILYGAILAIGQTDLMRLISYTSISHFGFIVLGIFALTAQGQSGSALYMVNHGIATAALFLIAGFLVTQRGSRLIADYGGVQQVAPVLAETFLVAGLATLSLPGLAPFVSEFLVLIGTYVRYPVAAVLAAGALVLSALYILWTYQRMFGGPVRLPGPRDDEGSGATSIRDLGVRQKAVVAPLLAALLVLGLFPGPILDLVDPAVAHTVTGPENPSATAGGAR